MVVHWKNVSSNCKLIGNIRSLIYFLAACNVIICSHNEIASSKLGCCLNFYIKRRLMCCALHKKYMASIQKNVLLKHVA